MIEKHKLFFLNRKTPTLISKKRSNISFFFLLKKVTSLKVGYFN
jgi:hypothetical protein